MSITFCILVYLFWVYYERNKKWLLFICMQHYGLNVKCPWQTHGFEHYDLIWSRFVEIRTLGGGASLQKWGKKGRPFELYIVKPYLAQGLLPDQLRCDQAAQTDRSHPCSINTSKPPPTIKVGAKINLSSTRVASVRSCPGNKKQQ